MNQSAWRTFLSLCLAAEQEDRLSLLFELLLTQEERENVAMRCMIVMDLLKQEKNATWHR